MCKVKVPPRAQGSWGAISIERKIEMNKCVVTYVEYGDGVDGHPRVLEVYDTWEEAKKGLEDDMKRYAKNLPSPEINYDEWEVWESCMEWEWGCTWNINKI